MTPDERQRALERIASYGELRLRCGGCDRMSDGHAHGWRGYLGREDDTVCVVLVCPGCAVPGSAARTTLNLQ